MELPDCIACIRSARNAFRLVGVSRGNLLLSNLKHDDFADFISEYVSETRDGVAHLHDCQVDNFGIADSCLLRQESRSTLK